VIKKKENDEKKHVSEKKTEMMMGKKFKEMKK
jgi:hypothetical protein